MIYPGLPRWLSEGEPTPPEGDVVLLTRLQLNRNAEDFLFPHLLDNADLIRLLAESDQAARKLFAEEPFSCEVMSCDEPSLRLFTEELALPAALTGPGKKPGRKLYLDSGGMSGMLLNWEDHFSLFQLGRGFEPRVLLAGLESMDARLEDFFPYSVSMDLGYLRAHIDRVGNGLSCQVLLHLPALSRSPHFDEVLAHAQREGMQFATFGSGQDSSPGQVYQLSHHGILGSNEEETLEKLALVVVEFIHYERDARASYLASGGMELEDSLWRDYGSLAHCRMLGLRESFELYSRVRLAICQGLIPRCADPGARGFFITQPAHVDYMAELIAADTPGRKKTGGRDAEDAPVAEDMEGVESARARIRASLFRAMLELQT